MHVSSIRPITAIPEPTVLPIVGVALIAFTQLRMLRRIGFV
jgi:hypothetical protein